MQKRPLRKIICSEDKPPARPRIDFHQRNLDTLKQMAGKKTQDLLAAQLEHRKLELEQARLSHFVLSRNKPADDALPPLESDDSKRAAYYQSRYSSLLKAMQESNRQKQERDQEERQRQMLKQEKLKAELGLHNVASKLHEPTLASLIASNRISEEDLLNLKEGKIASASPTVKAARREGDETKPKLSKEAAEKAQKRALEYLQQLAEKRQAEQRKEQEEQAKAQKQRAAARETVLNMRKTVSGMKTESPEEEEEFKRRFYDPELMAKMSKHRRNNAPMITDFAQWKKRNRVGDKTRVFMIYGGYPDVRKALERRGNVQAEGGWKTLSEFQVVNHFEKNSKVTTKVGLSHSLRNLVWFNSVDIDTFFPRCFDASETAEYEELIMEIKILKAESVLKQYVEGWKIPLKQAKVAMHVCSKRLKNLDDILDDPTIQDFELIKPEEWEVLSLDEPTDEDIQRQKHQNWFQRNGSDYVPPVFSPSKSVQGWEDHGDDIELRETARTVLEQLRERFPQFDLNGLQNAWIIKPAGLSRGRGIACFNSLVQIVDYLRKEGLWVVQKYIENPLLIYNKKFDIRQWVLVTDFNPLTIWFYESCYLRFGVEDYDIKNLQNRYIHLTNNSVVKHSDKFYETEIDGNMWHSDDFAEYLQAEYGSDLWNTSIKPQIKKIVQWSLEASQDMMDGRKNSCELFGYDIMIDSSFNPWLIEVNSSPAMDYSTEITKSLVKDVLEDAMKVLADYGYASAKKKLNVSTGGFSMIYRAKRTVEQPRQAFALNLLCEGKPLKKA